MAFNEIWRNKLLTEINYNFSRSSGSGGQNVNKVNTKVELRFSIIGSLYLTDSQKAVLLDKLRNRINNNKELIVVSEEERNQYKNKQIVTKKFFLLIEMALKKQKIRKPTKPTKSSIEKRLKAKKKHAEKKLNRRSNEF